MTASKKDEHDRLLKRTEELREDTAALSVDVTPFDQSEHDALHAKLTRHGADLAAHRLRKNDSRTP
jgi:hypothetical protein